jgi:hypothetical protein
LSYASIEQIKILNKYFLYCKHNFEEIVSLADIIITNSRKSSEYYHMNYNIWEAVIRSTLDLDTDTVAIDPDLAKTLREGLLQTSDNKYYLLTLEVGCALEIVRVCYVSRDGILLIKRGQERTEPTIWPAGTVMQAVIKAHIVSDLQLDLENILLENPETRLSSNGDLIIKEL